jgi:hypothetical protein
MPWTPNDAERHTALPEGARAGGFATADLHHHQGRDSLGPPTAVSFSEGFRTTALCLAAPPRWAVIRNAHKQPPALQKRSQELAPRRDATRSHATRTAIRCPHGGLEA